MTDNVRRRTSGPAPGTLIRVAAGAAALGIAASITEDYAALGKWFTVAGVLLMILALHRFGRLGPDAALEFGLPPPARKKKKKKRNAEPTSDNEAG